MARITRIVDAEQWTGTNQAAVTTLAGQAMFVNGHVVIAVVRAPDPEHGIEGGVKPMVVKQGEWIVKDRAGLSVKSDVTFQEQWGTATGTLSRRS